MTTEDSKEGIKDFQPLFHRIIDDGVVINMSRDDMAVYWVLLRFSNYNTRICYPSVKIIQKLSRVSKNKIAKAVKRLHEMGLIEVKKSSSRFQFRKIYHTNVITPSTQLRSIPYSRYKSKDTVRGSDGRFGGPPAVKDKAYPQETSCIIPEFTEQSKEGAANSEDAESRIVPENRDEVIPRTLDIKEIKEIKVNKEIKEGGLKADFSLSKPSPASPDSLKRKKSLSQVTNETLAAFKKTLGSSEALKHRLLKDGYPAEEVESLNI